MNPSWPIQFSDIQRDGCVASGSAGVHGLAAQVENPLLPQPQIVPPATCDGLMRGVMLHGCSPHHNCMMMNTEVSGNEEEVEEKQLNSQTGMHIHPAVSHTLQASSRQVVHSLLREKGSSPVQFTVLNRAAPLAITWHEMAPPSPKQELTPRFMPLPHKKRERDMMYSFGTPLEASVLNEVHATRAAAAHDVESNRELKRLRTECESAAFGAPASHPLTRWLKGPYKRHRDELEDEGV
uniref:Uncharacterized protein n=1 Tax=Trypanosoma congolense (strain IL3000) TaxID=1068625 RepID=G0UVL9_TRYCI|nr:conserved hypothetical protein [Trypanosoma congolense IL3000]